MCEIPLDMRRVSVSTSVNSRGLVMKKLSVKMEAMFGARFYPEQARIIEKLAKREGVSVSEYIRCAVLGDFLLSLDKEAVRYVLHRGAMGMRRNLRAHLKQLGEFEGELVRS